jgi:hypothetical protein
MMCVSFGLWYCSMETDLHLGQNVAPVEGTEGKVLCFLSLGCEERVTEGGDSFWH